MPWHVRLPRRHPGPHTVPGQPEEGAAVWARETRVRLRGGALPARLLLSKLTMFLLNP